jgi:type I restriction enzyme, S subunit
MNKRHSLFGPVQDDWDLKSIGDIATLRQGLQISKHLRISEPKENYIPLLKITDLPNRKFSEFVTGINKNYIASKNDIIYTRTGQVGLVYTDIEGCVHNNCFKVIVDYKQFDKNYIFYYLNNKTFRDYANNIASGSVQKDLTHKVFNNVPIAFPDLEKQRKIGEILKSLDDKIEINQQMNRTLEEMAMTLFNHWFVDFGPFKEREFEDSGLPKGWVVGTVRDVAAIFDSKRIPLSKMTREKRKGSYPYYGATSIMDYVDDYIFDGIYLLIGEDGSVMKSDGTPYTQYIKGKFWVNNHAHVLQGKNDISTAWLKVFFDSLNVSKYVTGAVQPKINQKNLLSIPFLIPPLDIRQKFNDALSNLFSQILSNQEENKFLIYIRDYLIPLLLSGKIEFENLEKQVEEVL